MSTEDLDTLISKLSLQSQPIGSYRSYLPVKINGILLLGFVDSGNTTATNCMSYLLAKKLKILKRATMFKNKTVGTAKQGQKLQIYGVIPDLPLQLIDHKGKEHGFRFNCAIIRNLSTPLNISGPFLFTNNLDQIHSSGCIRKGIIKFPLFESMSHARQEIKRVLPSSPITGSISTLDTNYIKVYSPNSIHRIQPGSLSFIPIVSKVGTKDISQPEGTNTPASFNYSDSFLNKIHTMSQVNSDEINLLSQAVDIQNQPFVAYLNDSDQCINISSNTYLGDLYLPISSSYLDIDISQTVSNLNINSADFNSSKFKGNKRLYEWDSNALTSKLNEVEKAKRRSHIQELLKVHESPFLKEDPKLVETLIDLISNHWSALHRSNNPGGTDLIEHPIYTPKGASPIKIKNRPISPALIDDLKNQICQWLVDGVIKKSSISPWNFPLLPVKKKNGTYRWVVDFRLLNRITRKDSFPIPNIIELLSHLSGSKYFTNLDLAAAFHAIPIRPCDQEKVSFSAMDRFYSFKKLPFGLSGGPSTWARLIIEVVGHIPKSRLLVFFDDLLIHSSNLKEHLSTLSEVLNSLNSAGLRINVEKSNWIRSETKFLGHIVSSNGVRVPDEFTDVIKQWPLPETLKQLRAFCGKINYYRRHLPRFGIVAGPLMEHLKGPSESSRKLNLSADPKAIQSFESLKTLLVSPQVLSYPDFNSKEPFIIDSDYCGEGIGHVLSQIQGGIERPLAYGARRLKHSESHYSSYKGEMLSLLFAIDQHKYFLTGRTFLVRTDNAALKWLKDQKDAKGMTLRWLRTLSTYDFKVEHRAGTKHCNADALSRAEHAPFLSEAETKRLMMDENLVQISTVSEDETHDSDEDSVESQDETEEDYGPLPAEFTESVCGNSDFIRQSQRKDAVIGKFISYREKDIIPSSQEYKMMTHEEKLYADLLPLLEINSERMLIKKPIPYTEEQGDKLCLPTSLQTQVMKAIHATNHAGANTLVGILKTRFYFPLMVSKVRHFVASCPRCQQLRKKKGQKHTYAHDLVGAPNEKLSLDFVGPLMRTRKGNTAILTCVDVYTRWFTAIPCKDQKADTVIKFLIERIIPDRGVPLVVHSDNGPAFASHVFKEAMRKFDITTTTTPIYNPKSNTVERYHRTLNRRVKSLIHEFNTSWDDALPQILLSMRTAVHRTTGYTPFFMEHGREARLPVELLTSNPPKTFESPNKYVESMFENFTKAFINVADNQRRYICRQQAIHSEAGKKILVGDLVWLYTDRPNPHLNRKFQSFWSGPFKVVQQISSTIFKIETHGNWSINPVTTVVAVDRLVKCILDEPDFNQGVPVELKAEDLVPYHQNTEVVGKVPASMLAPHIRDAVEDSDLNQQKMASKFANGPLMQHDNAAQIPSRNSDETPQNSSDYQAEGFNSTTNKDPVDNKSLADPIPHADVTLPNSDSQWMPAQHSTPTKDDDCIHTPPPTTEPATIPGNLRRPRGRPKGKRVKICSRCVTQSNPCVDHCPDCNRGHSCPYHSDRDRCKKCTRTRSCLSHT